MLIKLYTYNCSSGYSGDHCEKTPCFEVNCKNGGTCTVDGSQSLCKCVVGYSGDLCNQSGCKPINPCLNNGLCDPDPNDGSLYRKRMTKNFMKKHI